MWLHLTLTAFGLALVVAIIWGHLVLERALRFAESGYLVEVPEILPPLTVIRPIRGLDACLDDNLDAALALDYPGPVQHLFIFDDPSDPAVPLVRAAIARNPGCRARKLYCGSPPPNMTGKLNAMMRGMAATQTELVAFADSDTRPPPATLTRLVCALIHSSKTAAAFSPVVAKDPPHSLGDAIHSLLVNGLFGPALALAAARGRGELPVLFGQFVVAKRTVIQSVGGLEVAAGQLAGEVHLGARLAAAGYTNAVVPGRVPVHRSGMGLRNLLSVFARWAELSRVGSWPLALPWAVVLGFWLGMGLLATASIAGAPVALALGMLGALLSCASTSTLHRSSGGSDQGPAGPLVALCLLLALPAAHLRLVLWPRISLRGRVYRLHLSSRPGA